MVIACVITGFLVGLPIFYILNTCFSNHPLENFALVFSGEYRAIFNTLLISGVACAINFVIAVPIAWAVTRTDMPLKGLIRTLCSSIILIPSMLMVISYVFLFSSRGYINRYFLTPLNLTFNIYSYLGVILLIAGGTFFFMFIQALVAFESMDPNLENAARILGASRLYTLFRVTVPILAPSLTAGVILTFIMASLSLDVPLMVGLQAGVPYLTQRIYQLTTFPTNFPLASAISVVFMVFIFILVVVRTKMLGRKQYTTIVSGVRSELVRLGRMKYPLLLFCLLVVTVLIFLPLAVIAFMTFAKRWDLGLSLGNLTLENLRWVLLGNPWTMHSFYVSGILALVSATLAVALMTIASYVINRTTLRGRWFLDFLIWIPASTPGVVMALGILQAYIRPPLVLYGTVWILVVAYVTRCLPYVNRAISGSMVQLDASLEEASRILGGTWLHTLRRVTIPLIMPGFITSFLIAYILSFHEFSSSILLYTPGNDTVGVITWEMYRMGKWEMAAGITLIDVVITSCLFYIANKTSKRGLPVPTM